MLLITFTLISQYYIMLSSSLITALYRNQRPNNQLKVVPEPISTNYISITEFLNSSDDSESY